MNITAIKTRLVTRADNNITQLLDEAITEVHAGDIICITSKIVSICEGRIVVSENMDKDSLADAEAEYSLPRMAAPHGYVKHTITDGNLASSAGIDLSNGDGCYVLWPKNSTASATYIYDFLSKKYAIEDFGVIITDSRSMPLRYGAIGYAIGAYGIRPLNSYVGSADLFGRTMVAEKANIIDALAAAAVLMMGEGDESTPLAVIKDCSRVTFDRNAQFESIKVPLADDLYYPFLARFEESS